MKKNLTANEQLILAIEFLSLAEEYVIRKKELTSIALAEWLDELQDPEKEISDSQWTIERKFRNYTEKLKNSFGIKLNLKTKKTPLIKDKSIQLEILAIYLRGFCENYNEKLLRIYFRIMNRDFYEVLRNLVFLRYAIRFSLSIDFLYHKMMNTETSSRRVIPRYVHSRDQYLTLTATDLKDKTTKHFILVNIITFQNDLFSAYQNHHSNSKKISFDREKFNKSLENSFHRPMITYTIQFSSFSFEHFAKTNDIEFKILEKGNGSVLAEIISDDEFFIFASLFNYGDTVKLLKPEKHHLAFQKKISVLSSNYSI